jgi:hypothetical protein
MPMEDGKPDSLSRRNWLIGTSALASQAPSGRASPLSSGDLSELTLAEPAYALAQRTVSSVDLT